MFLAQTPDGAEMVVEKRQEPLQEDRPCVWTHPASGAITSRAARGPATVYVTGKTLEHVEALTSPCLATHVPDRSHIGEKWTR